MNADIFFKEIFDTEKHEEIDKLKCCITRKSVTFRGSHTGIKLIKYRKPQWAWHSSRTVERWNFFHDQNSTRLFWGDLKS